MPGIFLGYAIFTSESALLLLTFAGVLGGLSYAMRERQIELPHSQPDKEHMINLGILADCFVGVAGAYVVFLIIPSNIDDLNSIQVLATGVIGGYGGRILITQVLGGVLKQEVDQLKDQVNQNTNKITQTELEIKNSVKALALLERQFDEDFELPPEEIEQLKQCIKAASPTAQSLILKQAKDIRVANKKNNKLLMARTIPVFEALVESDTQECFHRNYAQLGYTLKDKTEPDWEKAQFNLTKAIEIRDKLQEKPEKFWFYEFNRAICTIQLDHAFKAGKLSPEKIREAILKDIGFANQCIKAKRNINIIELLTAEDYDDQVTSTLILDWLKLNNISQIDSA